MAKIPTGGFGRGATQAPVIRTAVSGAGVGAVAEAVANLGQTGMAVADRAQTVVDQEARRQKQQDETLARAKALNAQLDYEMAVQDATLQTEDSLATGGLDHRQAGQEYSSRWSRSSGRVLKAWPRMTNLPMSGALSAPLMLAR
ncbi:hypothetical protein SNK04_013982 [Fusarium graminearum]